MIKIRNLKLAILLECQNTKIKIKIKNKEKIIGTFCENELQKKKSKRVYNWKGNKEKKR